VAEATGTQPRNNNEIIQKRENEEQKDDLSNSFSRVFPNLFVY
jgi:hypothetical protein